MIDVIMMFEGPGMVLHEDSTYTEIVELKRGVKVDRLDLYSLPKSRNQNKGAMITYALVTRFDHIECRVHYEAGFEMFLIAVTEPVIHLMAVTVVWIIMIEPKNRNIQCIEEES